MAGTIVLAGALFLARVQEAERQPERAPVATAEAAVVAKLVDAWRTEPASFDRDAIHSQLVKLGAAVVPSMQRLVVERSPAMGLALQVLCRVGEPARPALPQIVAILGDREFVEPPGQREHETARGLLFDAIRDAAWAADEIVPVLARVAQDGREARRFRRQAGYALGRMGSAATPVLSAWIAEARGDPELRGIAFVALRESGVDAPDVVRPAAENDADPLQDVARAVLCEMEERSGRQGHEAYWAALIRREPFDAKVRGWLVNAKQTQNRQQLDPLTQEVKQRWRERLAKSPDAGLALQLALLVQDQLSNSELDFGQNHEYWAKEDPRESYATMAEVLRIAQASAEKWTPPWQRCLRGLARIALLRGDWDGMNAALAELGQRPIPAEQRPWLPPPPKDWKELAEHWQPCDPAMRSGDCAFEVHVEKDGHGLRGAHVWLREKPVERGWSSGIETRTLFLHPVPLTEGTFDTNEPWAGGFGYAADDRAQTRYAVTHDSGIARFEQLPPIEITIEVLIPTANFIEPGSQWDLWIRAPDGSLALNHYRWRDGFQLESGETVQGPHLVVRPHFAMNVAEGQALAPEFELTWDPLQESAATGAIRYEVELTLSFPAGKGLSMGADTMARLAAAMVETSGHSWPLGAQGVGDLKLVPGNVYLVQITAKDAQGGVLARYGRTACHVPWSHRESAAPSVRDLAREQPGFDDFAPIEAKLWHLGQFQDGGSGRVETLPERLDRFLSEHPDAFEVEYVRVARAWLRWHEAAAADSIGVAQARATLEELARTLPAGNVAADTARELVRRIDAHASPGKQLEFAAAAR